MNNMNLNAFCFMAVFGLFVGVPLFIWKLIEVVLWLYQHISFV